MLRDLDDGETAHILTIDAKCDGMMTALVPVGKLLDVHGSVQ